MAESNRSPGSQSRLFSENRRDISNSRDARVEVDAKLPLELSNFVGEGIQSTYQLDGNNLPPLSPDRDERMESRNSVDMEIESNGDYAIPYMDDEDNQSTSPTRYLEEQASSKNDYSAENVTAEKKSSPLKLSADVSTEFEQREMDSSVSKAVFADITDSALYQSVANGEELEFGEQQNLQRHVPCYLRKYDANFHANSGANKEEETNGARKDVGPLWSSHKQVQEDAYGAFRTDAVPYHSRNGKPLRRKQRDDKAVVIRSEEMQGYRGTDDLPALLEYIEGPNATKKIRDEQGKRTKKKAQGNGETALAPLQKKDKRSTTSSEETAGVTSEVAEKTRNGVESSLTNDLTASEPALSASGEEKFVTVINKKQNTNAKPLVRREKAVQIRRRRFTTPPPPLSRLGRQRRNSYDFSGISGYCNKLSGAGSTKEISLSSSSLYSLRLKTANGPTSDIATFASRTMFDNVDSELGNVSLTSVEAESIITKVSYANVAAAVISGHPVEETTKETKPSPVSAGDNRSKPSIFRAAATVESTITSLPIDLKNNIEFPALSAVATILERGRSIEMKEAVSLPPLGPDATPTVWGTIDFMRPSPDEAEKSPSDFNFGSNGDVAPTTLERVEKPRDQMPTATSGANNTVLQMIFDSCEGNSIGVVHDKNQIVTTSINGSDQKVEFLGKFAATASESCGLSFVFGDDNDEDAVMSAVMIKSVDPSAKASMCLEPEVNPIPAKGKSIDQCSTTTTDDSFSTKAFQEMANFAGKAWRKFTGGMVNLPYYVPPVMKQ